MTREKTVLYRPEGRIGRVTLNRPEVMNAINDRLPEDLAAAIAAANDDSDIHVIILSGAGPAFCAGYDLQIYAGQTEKNSYTQEMPWDPIRDYRLMRRNTDLFMSVWRSYKPVLCKIHGYAVAGGSDIALCSDLIVMDEQAKIGYMPSRVWGCTTTAMWVYRLGPEKAKRMLLTGDKINGVEAKELGLVYDAVPAHRLDETVDKLAHRMAGVPQNQLIMQKMMINQMLENMGLASTQMLANFFDGIARHSPEGMAFKRRAEHVGWKQAVRERDEGLYDWTLDRPMDR